MPLYPPFVPSQITSDPGSGNMFCRRPAGGRLDRRSTVKWRGLSCFMCATAMENEADDVFVDGYDG